jgi:hypothetical protein
LFPNSNKSRRVAALAALASAFAFRLGFGLCSEFWTSRDNQQIYLLGLKFYTTRWWPYFGPDVTATIQIPGALQGLLVGLPFFLIPIPEAPFVLVNVLSFAALSFFGWYCCRRFPKLPKWLVWSWLLTLPWTLNVSTTTFNPSYVLPAGIVFFVALLELYPFTTTRLIPAAICNVMMAAAMTWTMQLHLSWVLLVPYAALALYCQLRRRQFSSLLWFVVGAIVPATVLLPTFVNYGFRAGMGHTGDAVQINLHNVLAALNPVEGVLPRFLSFASYEIPRFLGNNLATRIAFLQANPWLIPFAIFLTVLGIVQPIHLIWQWFANGNSRADWRPIKFLTIATIAWLCVAFLFSLKLPAAHTFYLVMPIALLYALYAWERLLVKSSWQRFAAAAIACSIIFHAGLALRNFRTTSIYAARDRIVEALQKKDYRIAGERPAGAKY